MAQNIVVQVGQCGSQIGCRFWDLALREHASLMSPTNAKKCIYDASLSAFFRNVDETKSTSLPYPSPLRTLKARAVLVDMEEGVLRSILASPLRELFDGEQFIRDVSGAGNNWAVGNRFYGGKYRNVLSEEIRRQAEQCDSLQSFMLIHSMVSKRSNQFIRRRKRSNFICREVVRVVDLELLFSHYSMKCIRKFVESLHLFIRLKMMML